MPTFQFENPTVPFPTEIETERLHLRHLTFDIISTKELFELYSSLSTDTTQYVAFEPYDSIAQAHGFIQRSIDEFEAGNLAQYAIIEKKSGDYIGTANFSPKWNRSIAESGVFLLPDYWGNGYSGERGEAMIELSFETYEFDAWLSRCVVENTQSARAIEKYVVESNGGKRVGVIPNQEHNGELLDCILFSLRRHEYESHTET